MMQWFSSFNMPKNHLEIGWKFQAPGPHLQTFWFIRSKMGSGNQYFYQSPQVTHIFWWWSSEHILSNTHNSYGVHNTVPGTHELFFLFSSSHFLFPLFLKCPPPTPSLSQLCFTVSWGQGGSEAHQGCCSFKGSLNHMGGFGCRELVLTLFLPTSPRTLFLQLFPHSFYSI